MRVKRGEWKSRTAKDSGITICTWSVTETIAFSVTLNWKAQRMLCLVLHNIENKNGPLIWNNNLHAICLRGYLSHCNILIVKIYAAALVLVSHFNVKISRIIRFNATYMSYVKVWSLKSSSYISILLCYFRCQIGLTCKIQLIILVKTIMK
jgi:hypothetical protein